MSDFLDSFTGYFAYAIAGLLFTAYIAAALRKIEVGFAHLIATGVYTTHVALLLLNGPGIPSESLWATVTAGFFASSWFRTIQWYPITGRHFRPRRTRDTHETLDS